MGIKVWAIVSKKTGQPLILDVVNADYEGWGFEITTIPDGSYGNLAVFVSQEDALNMLNSANFVTDEEDESIEIKEFVLR